MLGSFVSSVYHFTTLNSGVLRLLKLRLRGERQGFCRVFSGFCRGLQVFCRFFAGFLQGSLDITQVMWVIAGFAFQCKCQLRWCR